jgi:hypothetical protein
MNSNLYTAGHSYSKSILRKREQNANERLVIWSGMIKGTVETLHLSQRPTPGHINCPSRSTSCHHLQLDEDRPSAVEVMADEGHNSKEDEERENSVVLGQNLDERLQSLKESFQDLGESFENLEGA